MVLLTPHRAVELTLLTFAKFREIKVVTENNESITESDKSITECVEAITENNKAVRSNDKAVLQRVIKPSQRKLSHH